MPPYTIKAKPKTKQKHQPCGIRWIFGCANCTDQNYVTRVITRSVLFFVVLSLFISFSACLWLGHTQISFKLMDTFVLKSKVLHYINNNNLAVSWDEIWKKNHRLLIYPPYTSWSYCFSNFMSSTGIPLNWIETPQ